MIRLDVLLLDPRRAAVREVEQVMHADDAGAFTHMPK